MFRQVRPNMPTPISTCSGYETAIIDNRQISGGILQITDSIIESSISHNIVENPRYSTSNIDATADALFVTFSDGWGEVLIHNNTIRNAKGVVGDYNKNELNLHTIFNLSLDEDGAYINRMIYFGDGFFSKITISSFTIEDSIMRATDTMKSSFFIKINRRSTVIPIAESFIIKDLYIKNAYWYGTWTILTLEVPVTLENAVFEDLEVNPPFSSQLSSDLTWINVITKPDEVITLKNVTFSNILSKTVPSGIKISKGTLTGTQLAR